MRAPRMTRRRWAALIALAALAVAARVATRGRDPWPVRMRIGPTAGHRDGFTRDGRGVVTTAFPVMSTAWDLETGRPRASAEPGLRRVSPAPDGRSLVGVTGNDKVASAVIQVDRESGAVRARFALTAVQALAPTLASDGTSIRAVLVDPRRRTFVATWDLATGAEARREVFGPPGPGPRVAPKLGDTWFQESPVAFAPDGRTWAYAQVNPVGIRLWDAEADRAIGGLIPGPPGGVAAAIFAPDGRSLIVGDGIGGFTAHDLAGSTPARSCRVAPGAGLFLASLAISPDGRTLAAGWIRPNRGPTSPLARFWLDAQDLITGRPPRDSQIMLIDLPHGRARAEAFGTSDPEFSPDGRLLITRESDSLTLGVRAVPSPSR